MNTKKPTVIINNIPGVAIKRSVETVEIYFLKSLSYDEWREVEGYIDQLLKKGSSHFIFYLQKLTSFTSYDIGMWVTLNAKINSLSGKLDFILGHDSNVHKYMKFANLDKIFSFIVKNPDQDNSETYVLSDISIT